MFVGPGGAGSVERVSEEAPALTLDYVLLETLDGENGGGARGVVCAAVACDAGAGGEQEEKEEGRRHLHAGRVNIAAILGVKFLYYIPS